MGNHTDLCYFWRAGRCNRHPCPFFHSDDVSSLSKPRSLVWKKPRTIPPRPSIFKPTKRSIMSSDPTCIKDHKSAFPSCNPSTSSPKTSTAEKAAIVNSSSSILEAMVCSSSSVSVEKFAREKHVENSFSLLATLQGHRIITGVALPSGGSPGKLFSGDKDGSLRVWDCHTGQCAAVFNFGGAVGCVISEGSWLFIGIPNVVKAWNSETQTGLLTLLTAPYGQNTTAGQVCALAPGTDDLVFAGTHNGHIVSWKYTAAVLQNNYLQPATCINNAHKLPIISLIVGKEKLYSGSVDTTIRIWKIMIKTGALHSCLRTITGHTEAVTSLICWDHYLISCSLDKTIKVWGMAETEDHLREYYTHTEEHGLGLLAGLNDYHLLCSQNDNSLQIYDLPSFEKRGSIFFKGEVSAVYTSEMGGLFFTGDATGDLKVWNWSTDNEKKPAIN